MATGRDSAQRTPPLVRIGRKARRKVGRVVELPAISLAPPLIIPKRLVHVALDVRLRDPARVSDGLGIVRSGPEDRIEILRKGRQTKESKYSHSPHTLAGLSHFHNRRL